MKFRRAITCSQSAMIFASTLRSSVPNLVQVGKVIGLSKVCEHILERVKRDASCIVRVPSLHCFPSSSCDPYLQKCLTSETSLRCTPLRGLT